jgi:hypothetical protein
VNFDDAAPFGAAFFIGAKVFMKKNGASIKQRKQRGEWAELRFMARASEQGLLVSKPWGDTSRYDFIVEHAGKLMRVQVKSTTFRKNRSYICTLRALEGQPYTSSQIDFVAAYIIPKNIWYIFPIEAILKCTRQLTLSPHMKLSKNSPYQEAWHLMCGGRMSGEEAAELNPLLREGRD